MGDLLVINLPSSMWRNVHRMFSVNLRAYCCLMLLISASVMTFGEPEYHQRNHHHQKRRMNNFVSVNYLPNGQIETRVHYNGISAKETSASNRNDSGLTVRELTDGRRFIHLVYENGTLKDCNYGKRRQQIQSFLNIFDDSNRIEDTNNITVSTSSLVIENLDNKKLIPENVRKWFNYPKLRKLCRKKKRHGKKKNVQRQSFGLSLDMKDQPKPLFVMPGTMWCGDRDIAPSYNALGVFSETDRCCRRHDFCQKNIHAFTRKYELFNGRPFTVSHCYCDASFRACLKMVGSSDADIVGKIFFNWVQTKCFVIKRKRLCAEWEGTKCVKKQTVKKAVLRTNLPY
ncbi:Phospholipase A2 [Popillia japonica]|uniref:phospholipase A2 n=1 Tax=Popillia japonica TaxID=7064 RepID=A0AAW1N2F0_POPJA